MKKILFTDGSNQIIQKVAEFIIDQNIAIPVLLFDISEKVPTSINKKILIEKVSTKINEQTLDLLAEKRKNKNTRDEIIEMLKLKENYSFILLIEKKVDCLVGGLDSPSSKILKPAIMFLDKKPGIKYISSCFLMQKNTQKYIFTDCALIIDPNTDMLIDITKNAVDFSRSLNLYNNKPTVALLSFSTFGSGKPEYNEYIVKAKNKLELFYKHKSVNIIGEIQFDAAFNKRVFLKKTKNDFDNNIPCNIFVFPNLYSGNIGYKICEYMGEYQALGVFILGLNQNIIDLSRGAKYSEILDVCKTVIEIK